MIDMELTAEAEEAVTLHVSGIDTLPGIIPDDETATGVLSSIFSSFGKVTELRIYQASFRRTTSMTLGTPERTPAYAIIKMDRKEFAQVQFQPMLIVSPALLDSLFGLVITCAGSAA